MFHILYCLFFAARLKELTAGGMTTSSAVKMAAKDLGMKKSMVYRIALTMSDLSNSSNRKP